MNNIRQAQFDTFAAEPTETFVAECSADLRKHWAGRCAELDEPGVEKIVRACHQRAHGYGLRSEQLVYRFINLAFLLGLDFDSSGHSSGAHPILTDSKLLPDEKLHLIISPYFPFPKPPKPAIDPRFEDLLQAFLDMEGEALRKDYAPSVPILPCQRGLAVEVKIEQRPLLGVTLGPPTFGLDLEYKRPPGGELQWFVDDRDIADFVTPPPRNGDHVTLQALDVGIAWVSVHYLYEGRTAVDAVEIVVGQLTLDTGPVIVLPIVRGVAGQRLITATGRPAIGSGRYGWNLGVGNSARFPNLPGTGSQATVEGVQAGDIPLLATYNVFRASIPVTPPTTLRVLEVTLDRASIGLSLPGPTTALRITATPSHAPGKYDWNIADTKVADFAVQPGQDDHQVTINARQGGQTTLEVGYTHGGERAVTQVPLTVVSVSLNPPGPVQLNPPLGALTQRVFTATGVPAGPPNFAWTLGAACVAFQGNPNNTNQATVDSAAPGQARLQVDYTFNGIVATATADVNVITLTVTPSPAVLALAGPGANHLTLTAADNLTLAGAYTWSIGNGTVVRLPAGGALAHQHVGNPVQIDAHGAGSVQITVSFTPAHGVGAAAQATVDVFVVAVTAAAPLVIGNLPVPVGNNSRRQLALGAGVGGMPPAPAVQFDWLRQAPAIGPDVLELLNPGVLTSAGAGPVQGDQVTVERLNQAGSFRGMQALRLIVHSPPGGQQTQVDLELHVLGLEIEHDGALPAGPPTLGSGLAFGQRTLTARVRSDDNNDFFNGAPPGPAVLPAVHHLGATFVWQRGGAALVVAGVNWELWRLQGGGPYTARTQLIERDGGPAANVDQGGIRPAIAEATFGGETVQGQVGIEVLRAKVDWPAGWPADRAAAGLFLLGGVAAVPAGAGANDWIADVAPGNPPWPAVVLAAPPAFQWQVAGAANLPGGPVPPGGNVTTGAANVVDVVAPVVGPAVAPLDQNATVGLAARGLHQVGLNFTYTRRGATVVAAPIALKVRDRLCSKIVWNWQAGVAPLPPAHRAPLLGCGHSRIAAEHQRPNAPPGGVVPGTVATAVANDYHHHGTHRNGVNASGCYYCGPTGNNLLNGAPALAPAQVHHWLEPFGDGDPLGSAVAHVIQLRDDLHELRKGTAAAANLVWQPYYLRVGHPAAVLAAGAGRGIFNVGGAAAGRALAAVNGARVATIPAPMPPLPLATTLYALLQAAVAGGGATADHVAYITCVAICAYDACRQPLGLPGGSHGARIDALLADASIGLPPVPAIPGFPLMNVGNAVNAAAGAAIQDHVATAVWHAATARNWMNAGARNALANAVWDWCQIGAANADRSAGVAAKACYGVLRHALAAADQHVDLTVLDPNAPPAAPGDPWRKAAPKMFGCLRATTTAATPGGLGAGVPVLIRSLSGGISASVGTGAGNDDFNVYWAHAYGATFFRHIHAASNAMFDYGLRGGTFGRCAAPKLLHAAIQLRLRVESMAEIWIGRTKGAKVDGKLVASCPSCKEILEHMLCDRGGVVPVAIPNIVMPPVGPNGRGF